MLQTRQQRDRRIPSGSREGGARSENAPRGYDMGIGLWGKVSNRVGKGV